jgi:hypothetical protein
MEFDRGVGRPDPVPAGPVGRGGAQEDRRVRPSTRLGAGTLACPSCDLPVALAAGRASPADPIGCPFCGHAGAVRDFLTLGEPSRPAHVEVRVIPRARHAA